MTTARPDVNTTRLLWAVAVACAAALGLALAAQYVWDMQPCPWCVLQRGIFIVIALLCGLAAVVRRRVVRVVLSGLSLLLALAGIASALYQHLVAAQSYSCAFTFADRIIGGLKLDALLPSVFSATASCSEASVSVLGVPFAYWSLAMFVLVGACSAAVIGRSRKR